MSTKTARMGRMTVAALAVVVGMMAGGRSAHAFGSDVSGAVLIFPKIVVDTSGQLLNVPTDTEIQITNTSNSVISARCYWVDATSHCSNDPEQACRTNSDCDGGICRPGWVETDFRFTLTKRQPISFTAGQGLLDFPLANAGGPAGQSNNNADGSPSAIPPVSGDPFFGELRCIQVDPNDFAPTGGVNPNNDGAGDLAGNATIVRANSEGIDARKYNGVALAATGTNNRDETLVIGGPDPEYSSCPNVLLLNHFFDGANVESHFSSGPAPTSGVARTDLTVVPCGADYLTQENNLGGATLQYLIFNEFEQRFSASNRFDCFKEVQLSDIDTRPGPSDDGFSIFNVNVQGTISGQTRVRAVQTSSRANGIVGIAERFFTCEIGPDGNCSSAENLSFTGVRATVPDRMILSPEMP